MSQDAIRHVRAWTHPEATRSVRAFFEAIAESIPEGHTTTPPLTLDDLAALGHQAERTARTNKVFLEGLGEVKVHDGGRGRKTARYEMVQLTSGTRPITATPLPLRADLRAALPARTKEQRSTSDLFADGGDQTSDLFADVPTGSDLFADVWQKVGSFCRRFGAALAKVGNLIRRCQLRTIKQRSTSDLFLDAPELLTTARDVPPLKETTTTTAPRDGPAQPTAVKPPPCRWLGKSHAWCDVRFHVPMDFHEEERRKLPRQPGETDADLDAQLFAHYAAVFAAVPATADLRRFKNDFEICRAYLRVPSPETAPKARAPAGDGRDVYAEQVPPRRRWRR